MADQNLRRRERESEPCGCKYCAAGFWARYCIGTRELTPAETARVEEILARHDQRSKGTE